VATRVTRHARREFSEIRVGRRTGLSQTAAAPTTLVIVCDQRAATIRHYVALVRYNKRARHDGTESP